VALSVDTRRIVRAWVVPWESDEGLYGIAYELGEDKHGTDLIGTKSEAERVLSHIPAGRVVAFQVTGDDG
jgi:hypothetical protein